MSWSARRAHNAVTLLSVLNALLAGCVLPGSPPQGRGQSLPADGMWRSVGYGWIFSVLGRAPAPTRIGSTTQGVGIPPTVGVPVFTPAELAQHQDPALDVPWSS